jgi:hypothetical protein
MLHKTLFTISCISCSLYAMEQDTSAVTTTTNNSNFIQPIYNPKNYYPLNTLYKKACSAFENYNPHDNQSIKNVFQLITEIEELQSKGIDEKELGHFAYIQTNNPPLAITLYQKPLYISVILERIRQHKAHMKKNDFIAPTEEQFIQYMDNMIGKEFADCRLILDPHNIPITHFSQDIMDGLQEFKQLITDIHELKQKHPTITKKAANYIYNPQL